MNRDRLGGRKPANVVSAAIANRWVRRLYHELQGQEGGVATATEAA